MLRRLAAVPFILTLAFPALAATRMTFEIQGAPTAIEWAPTSFPLRYAIDPGVTKLSPTAAGMVDRAFATWAALPDTNIGFETRGVVPGAISTEGVSVSVANDLLSGQGAIALTRYSYDTTTGRMLDADITVDPSLFNGQVNAQLALEHEVGHVLGLDHSAVLSAVMYPYVGPEGSPTELDTDDRIAVSTVYAKSDPTLGGATLQGRVYGDSGAVYAAQVVAVNQQGEPVATSLTNTAGEFTLAGVPAGTYQIYAEPLDGPMVVESLQGTWRTANVKPFPTEFYSQKVHAESGKVYGNLVVNTAGSARLNPRLLGGNAPDVQQVSLSSMPVFVSPGQTIKLTVGGEGFVSGMTTFEVLSPAFRRLSDFEWWDGSVGATFAVDPGAAADSSIILVRNGNESATLTGALRVVRPPKSRSARH